MDKPYELSALDLSILRTALRVHLEKVRNEFHDKYYVDSRKEIAEEQLATEDLIERFDNADNVWMEINI